MQHKIVIITDGKETHARQFVGKKVIKSAMAKCSPDDAFDFNIGAKLAFERLMGDGKPKEGWRVVKRTVKVGDYIRLLTNGGYHFSRPGDILKVSTTFGGSGVSVLGKDHPRHTDDDNYLWNYAKYEYEVVERVSDEKEKEPKYYNGKIVCVKSGYWYWTAGRVYEMKEGNIADNDGDIRETKAITFDDITNWAKRELAGLEFIPYVD